jgi:hypothetical protein
MVRRRSNLNGLLQQSKEQLASRSRRPPVEAKRKLVEVVIEVLGAHRALVCPKQPTFQQRCDAVDARQQLAGCIFVFVNLQNSPTVRVPKRL